MLPRDGALLLRSVTVPALHVLSDSPPSGLMRLAVVLWWCACAVSRSRHGLFGALIEVCTGQPEEVLCAMWSHQLTMQCMGLRGWAHDAFNAWSPVNAQRAIFWHKLILHNTVPHVMCHTALDKITSEQDGQIETFKYLWRSGTL